MRMRPPTDVPGIVHTHSPTAFCFLLVVDGGSMCWADYLTHDNVIHPALEDLLGSLPFAPLGI